MQVPSKLTKLASNVTPTTTQEVEISINFAFDKAIILI